MFKELLDLGERLELQGKLPPPGFYSYKEPIKWVIHFYPGEPNRSTIRQAEINNLPRPYSGRTSGIQAYPLADEAAYVLGIDHGKGKGKNTTKKHAEFLKLLDKIAQSAEHHNPQISHIAKGIKDLIEGSRLKSLPVWEEIQSKDWVSVQVEGSKSDGKQLVEHRAIREFWIKELAELCLPGTKEGTGKAKPVGECAVSGRAKSTLVARIPLAVTLYKPAPIHSLNADAFVSGMEGTGVFKRCHIGQSIEAGDLIARTLNYLRNEPLHHKILARAIEGGKLNTDSQHNLFAFYWIEQREEAKSALGINPPNLLSKTSLLFGEARKQEQDTTASRKGKPRARLPVELSQLVALLKIPWTGQPQALLLDEYAFCLLMLSPNKGRISVREWFKVSLARFKENLKDFLVAQRIEAPDGGEQRCFAIQDMLRALEKSNISQPEYMAKEVARPNITRALLRCAFLGEAPPAGLLEPAVICSRHPSVIGRHEQKSERDRFAILQHELAAVMKLILTHPRSEVHMNSDDDQTHLEARSAAFLCGRLLSVLEEAQLVAMKWKINTTLVDQFYSTAANAPFSVMGMLIARITSQHMSKLRKNMRTEYDKLEALLEKIQTTLDALGGFPKTLTLKQQAEFSLGFYTQRAAFRREHASKKPTVVTIGQPTTGQGGTL